MALHEVESQFESKSAEFAVEAPRVLTLDLPEEPGRSERPLHLSPQRPRSRAGSDDERAQSGPDIHLLDYARVIYKHRWVALTALVVVIGSATIYNFTATPIYRARARVLIESENPNVVSYREVVAQNRATNDYYQTQYRILESRALATRALESGKLWSDPEFTGLQTPGAVTSAIDAAKGWLKDQLGWSKPIEAARPDETRAQAQAVDRLLSRLTVAAVRGSRLVDIVYESPDRAMAAQVVNLLTSSYIEQNMAFRFSTTMQASDWLNKQMAEQRKNVEAGEIALQQYRESNDAVSLEERQNIVVQRLADVNAAVTKARTTRIEKESLYEQLQSIQADRAAVDTFPAIMSNGFIQQLKTELAELQGQQAQLGEKLGDRHPEMLKIRSAIQAADTKLQGEIGKVVQSIRNEFEAARSQERSLMGSLEQQKTEALALNRKAIEYGVLQRDATSSRQLFEGLMQRAKETTVSGDLKTTNIQIVDAAEVPRGPARPQPLRNMLLALLGGGLLAIGLAFFFEYIDNRIKSPDELRALLGLPQLGMVPVSGDKGASTPLLGSNAAPNFAEAFKAIRTNVLFSSAKPGCRTLVVTSTAPGEGKTVTAANLAIALAQTGQRVLLIDGDMRRPRVHDLFEQNQEPGLSNVLVGNAKIGETVHEASVEGLSVMPGGHCPPNPSELLGSRRFGDLLAALERHFEWIIVDTPPVMAVTDACVVAHLAEGVLFVVGAEMVSRQAIKAAVEQLERIEARFVGVVLNRVDLERNAYYYSRYYHHSYNRYYQSAATN
jgi:polysaccharide biosynthesis transport protein